MLLNNEINNKDLNKNNIKKCNCKICNKDYINKCGKDSKMLKIDSSLINKNILKPDFIQSNPVKFINSKEEKDDKEENNKKEEKFTFNFINSNDISSIYSGNICNTDKLYWPYCNTNDNLSTYTPEKLANNCIDNSMDYFTNKTINDFLNDSTSTTTSSTSFYNFILDDNDKKNNELLSSTKYSIKNIDEYYTDNLLNNDILNTKNDYSFNIKNDLYNNTVTIKDDLYDNTVTIKDNKSIYMNDNINDTSKWIFNKEDDNLKITFKENNKEKFLDKDKKEQLSLLNNDNDKKDEEIIYGNNLYMMSSDYDKSVPINIGKDIRSEIRHELINLDVLEIDKEFIRQLIRLIENTNHISQETFDRLKEIINKI